MTRIDVPVCPPNSSGITVIVVGLGIGGLTAAISCHLRGHQVIGFDKLESLEPHGDGIMLSPNGARVISDLDGGEIRDWLKEWSYTCRDCKIMDMSGHHVGQHPIPETDTGTCLVPRGGLAQRLYQTAKALELDLRLGVKITEFEETDDYAAVIVDNKGIRGDCIIFADGASCKARAAVSTRHIHPYQSGFSVYRGKADRKALLEDPGCNWLLDPQNIKDCAQAFSGPNMYMLMSTCGKGKACFCVAITRQVCQNTRPLEGSWTTPVDKEEMVDVIKDWKCRDQIIPVIDKISSDQFFLCPLVRAGVLDSWVSPNGRVALIGDAAHPFFPTSAQGASQAIEDAATVAETLHLAGKSNIKLGLQAMWQLRKHRATYIQRNAWRVNDAWFESPEETRKGQNAAPAIGVIDWITNHCCRAYARDEFDRVRQSIETGEPYVPTNLPVECKLIQLRRSRVLDRVPR
ncbi:hypothetical protein BJX99DRAFT_244260 [Aspergillus californicus]